MLFATIVLPLPDGRFRAIVPDIPDFTLEGPSVFVLQDELPAAIEAHLDTSGRRFMPKSRASVHYVSVYGKRNAAHRSRRPPMTPNDLRKLEAALSALLACRGLLPDLVNEAVRTLREVRAELPEFAPRPLSALKGDGRTEMSFSFVSVPAVGPEGRGKKTVVAFTDETGTTLADLNDPPKDEDP